jgi:hypothetical protein
MSDVLPIGYVTLLQVAENAAAADVRGSSGSGGCHKTPSNGRERKGRTGNRPAIAEI